MTAAAVPPQVSRVFQPILSRKIHDVICPCPPSIQTVMFRHAVAPQFRQIYVRVSTKEQTENLSLPTQLRACEEYCHRQGYEILERFQEEGESAKSTDRSQLQNLLTFCRLNKGRVHFVVVFNLTRFARDKYDHFALRSHLQSLGISLRSAMEPIAATPPPAS